MTLHDLGVAVALMMMIEGVLYALFPHGIKDMMRWMVQNSDETLRTIGLLFATVGAAFLWLVLRL